MDNKKTDMTRTSNAKIKATNFVPEKNISVSIDVKSFMFATHRELRATRSSKAATTEAKEEQIGSGNTDNNSQVLLYLAMIRDA